MSVPPESSSEPSEPSGQTYKRQDKQDKLAAGELLAPELFWRDNAKWLESQGYVLPARYQPGWIPSWKGTKKSLWRCPDRKHYRHVNIMHAHKKPDNALVMLKLVDDKEFPQEIEIAQLLSQDTSDRQNHCVPVLDLLTIPNVKGSRILVMPYLLDSDHSPWDTIGEAVAFCEQIIEGLAFIHSKRIFHGDVKSDNILMDGKHLFRTSFHPIDPTLTADCSNFSRMTYRTEKPVKYYFIDYGLSSIVENVADARKPGFWGGDKSVPEFEVDEPHDPFAIDVYCTGNIMRHYFVYGKPEFYLKAKKGFGFLKPLVDDMCQDDPTKRPKMDEVVRRFHEVKKSLNSSKLRSRIAEIDENPVAGLFRSIGHWARRISYIVRRKPAIPSL